MNNFWKKTGWFFIALGGLLSSMVLQVLMGIVALVPVMILESRSIILQGITDVDQITQTMLSGDRVLLFSGLGVMAYHILSLPVFGLWYYYGCGRRKPQSPRKVLGGKGFLLTVAAGFGLSILSEGIGLLFMIMTPNQYDSFVQLMGEVGNLLPVVFSAVFLAPIGEELLCRGILLYCFEKVTVGMKNKKLAFWIANVLQALCFGIMHGNLVQGSYAFVLGMGLGYLRKQYDSLYPAMLGHLVINFLSVTVMGYLLSPIPENLLGAFILLLLGLCITLFVMFAVGKRKKHAEIA